MEVASGEYGLDKVDVLINAVRNGRCEKIAQHAREEEERMARQNGQVS